jgi:opacity protein-like surface antigen
MGIAAALVSAAFSGTLAAQVVQGSSSIPPTQPGSVPSRRTLASDDPETQLMGYYAAVMQFTPVGLPSKSGSFEIGGAASFIPAISLSDRTAGFGGTKVENTNLCSVFPRITASKGFGRFGVEAGYTPPVSVCGVKATVVGLAIGRRMVLGATWDGYARLSAMSGTVDVSSTCSASAIADPLDETCYGGSISHDKIAPFSGTLEFDAAYQGWRAARLEPYLGAGIRYERVNFDVNYTRDSTQGAAVTLPPLDDHNRLRATLTRVHLVAGMAWDVVRHVRIAGELYYAPGALMTIRGRAAVAL